MRIILLKLMLKIRWWYFHVSPMYMKFYMDSAMTEAHFQHRKTGETVSNYTVVAKGGSDETTI